MNFWKNKKVLITGGAGFIGSNLAIKLVKKKADVRIADNVERGCKDNLKDIKNSIEFYKKDLSKKQNCLEVCSDIEIVFHLAAKVGGVGYYLEKPAEVLMQNMLIDTLMLQAVQKKKVKRCFYASSGHVYPTHLQTKPNASLLLEEQAIPANPSLSYGWEKLIAEQEIKAIVEENSRFRAVILRIFGAFGGSQDLNLKTGSAIPVFIRRAIEYPKRKPFKIMSSGQETRSYCYIDDIVSAILLGIEKLDNNNLIGPINIGSEERITIQGLAKKIVTISEKNIEIINKKNSNTKVWGQVPNCSKAKKILGWKPQNSLNKGLNKTYKQIEERFSKGNV